MSLTLLRGRWAHGQYLPFDPPLAGKGATLGGTVAAGLSGPSRHRYGGLRDFLLGVRFVDGEGRAVRGGRCGAGGAVRGARGEGQGAGPRRARSRISAGTNAKYPLNVHWL